MRLSADCRSLNDGPGNVIRLHLFRLAGARSLVAGTPAITGEGLGGDWALYRRAVPTAAGNAEGSGLRGYRLVDPPNAPRNANWGR